jgi:hypothetical protein
MNLHVLFLVAGLVAGLLGTGLLVLLGYKWGTFAALQALARNSPKWKAYALALMPPAAFAVALLFDGSLEPFAGTVFWVLATSAAIGACVRINHSSHSML